MADPFGMAAQMAGHTARLGWYWALNQLVDGRISAQGARPRYKPQRPVPSQRELFSDLVGLMREDAAAVGSGLRPPLGIMDSPLPDHLARLRAMLDDAPEAARRRAEQDHATARLAEAAADLPDYYRQDFHFQSGGYLTDTSARLYDLQVETLFYGAAQLMRRTALDPISRHVRGRDQRRIGLLDVACGTGRLLRDVRLSYPGMRLTGLDLSEAYLSEARRHLARLRPASWIAGNAEAIPLPDSSQDIVTTVFLFHELPPQVRRQVTREMARVLKPGGLLVLVDSLQMGDRAAWDGLLEGFPERFHEPYYRHYAIDDLDGMLTGAGLEALETRTAFLCKVMARRKV